MKRLFFPCYAEEISLVSWTQSGWQVEGCYCCRAACSGLGAVQSIQLLLAPCQGCTLCSGGLLHTAGCFLHAGTEWRIYRLRRIIPHTPDISRVYVYVYAYLSLFKHSSQIGST